MEKFFEKKKILEQENLEEINFLIFYGDRNFLIEKFWWEIKIFNKQKILSRKNFLIFDWEIF